jgi:hypothetical protein
MHRTFDERSGDEELIEKKCTSTPQLQRNPYEEVKSGLSMDQLIISNHLPTQHLLI